MPASHRILVQRGFRVAESGSERVMLRGAATRCCSASTGTPPNLLPDVAEAKGSPQLFALPGLSATNPSGFASVGCLTGESNT